MPQPVFALTSWNKIWQFWDENLSAKANPSLSDTSRAANRSFLFAIMILGTFWGALSPICKIHLLKFSKDYLLSTAQARMIADDPLQQVQVIVRYLYCPAVSQICNLIFFSSTSKVLALKSTPMVATQLSLKFSPTKLRMMLVLPTPVSPMMIILASKSWSLGFIINIINRTDKLAQDGYSCPYLRS